MIYALFIDTLFFDIKVSILWFPSGTVYHRQKFSTSACLPVLKYVGLNIPKIKMMSKLNLFFNCSCVMDPPELVPNKDPSAWRPGTSGRKSSSTVKRKKLLLIRERQGGV